MEKVEEEEVAAAEVLEEEGQGTVVVVVRETRIMEEGPSIVAVVAPETRMEEAGPNMEVIAGVIHIPDNMVMHLTAETTVATLDIERQAWMALAQVNSIKVSLLNSKKLLDYRPLIFHTSK